MVPSRRAKDVNPSVLVEFSTRYQLRSARPGIQRTATDRAAPQADAVVIRLNFIPNCQRSIVVVKFWCQKSRQAGPKRPESG